jgi:excisionase family DNA binding protein
MSTTFKHPPADLDRTPIAQGENLEPISVRIATAVKLTGIGRSTLYELIGSGEIETVKIGRSTLIPYRSLKRLILR